MKKIMTIILMGLVLQTVQAESDGISVYGFCVKQIASMMGPENHNISMTTKNKRVISALIKRTHQVEDISQNSKLAARAYYWGRELTGVVIYDYPDCYDENGDCEAYRTEYFYEVIDINDDPSQEVVRFNHLGTYFGDDQGPEMLYICKNSVSKIKI